MEATPVPCHYRARADWEQQYYRAEHAIDRNPKTGWAIAPQIGRRHFLIAETKTPIDFAERHSPGFRFDHYHGNSHTIGRMRISVTTETDPDALWPVPDEIATLLETAPVGANGSASRLALARIIARFLPSIRRLERELFRLNQRETELRECQVLDPRDAGAVGSAPAKLHSGSRQLSGERQGGRAGRPRLLAAFARRWPTNRLALARWLLTLRTLSPRA